MTCEEVERMPAGVDLDELVAKLAMGWPVYLPEDGLHDGDTPRPHCCRWPTPGGDYERLMVYRPGGGGWWRPSGSVADAWEVVEAVSARVESHGWAAFHLTMHSDGSCSCYFGTQWDGTGRAETMPLAVCRAAALWAIGGKEATQP